MDNQTAKSAARLVSALGGQVAVAKMFGITQPSVFGWTARGIPTARLQTLQVLAKTRPEIKRALAESGYPSQFRGAVKS